MTGPGARAGATTVTAGVVAGTGAAAATVTAGVVVETGAGADALPLNACMS